MTGNSTYEDADKITICRGDIDYQGIVKHINDGVVIIREGNIVFANNAFYEISRKSPDQVIGVDFSSFISPCDREQVTRYCTERLFSTSLSDRIEFAMIREGGEAIIEMKVSVVECGGSPSILAALTDISERRKTRLELERLKDRLQSILHSMNEIVVSFSPDDYAILSINPAAEALYGVPLRDFTSGHKHIFKFVHPDDKAKVEEFYHNLPEAEFDQAEYRVVSANKKVRWVLDEGHIVYSTKGNIRRIDHVIRDITEEKKAIDALKQSEAKYRDFFESTSDMAYAVTPQGMFIDINEAGLKLLGFENKEEALASNLKNFYVDPAERAELLAELGEKGAIVGKQVRLKSKAGDVIEVAVTARAKTDDSGELLYNEGIVHNLTQALEDQRNRVLRNAAGGMCHYLNTHLMQLDASKEVLAEEMTALETLIQRINAGEASPETASHIRATMDSMNHYLDGIKSAYDRISEVTRAFNRAFLYKEEPYATGTILDIFRAHGYEADEEGES